MTKAWLSGCHRDRAPDETLRAIQPWLRSCGITRVADVTGLDYPGIPTVMVVRPNARSLSVTQGKGLTLEAAKASGIMEAIELDHAETPELPLVLGRLSAVASRACHVSKLPCFPRGPGALTGDTRLLWAEAEVLGKGDTRLVPYEMVHLDLTLPLPESSGYFPLSSNGLASGNSLLEATAHALYELIERDARTLFFLTTQRDARRLDQRTIDDAVCAALLEQLAHSGLEVALWDLTSDVGVATVLAAMLDRDDNPFRRAPLAYGSGAHLDRNVALIRAVTEAAQTRLTNIVGARDDTLPASLDYARNEERQRAYRKEVRSMRPATRAFHAMPHHMFESFEEDVALLLQRLAACGLDDVLRVDLSRVGWPIHVVRMLVPGLEAHIDMPDYRPGARAEKVLTLS